MEQLISQTKEKMNKAIDHLNQELTSVRTGRANPALIEQLKVDAYGSPMVLRDIASINSPEPRLLVVQPWDKANSVAIIKAIREAGQSLNPVEESDVIRVPIPQLNEERRKELIKLVREKAESSKVVARSARREAMDRLEKDEKAGKISKDDKHRFSEQVQKVTTEVSAKIDDILKSKESDLTQL